MPRPACTIVLITSERLARADLPSSKAEAAQVWHKDRPMVEDAGLLVDTALRLGPDPARQVFVLTTDVWTQILGLSLASTRKASPAELLQALKFEAEALAGVSAFEVEGAFAELETIAGERRYWLSLVPASQLAQVDAALEVFGARLGGIGHPGGLPRPLTEVSHDAPWNRLELWPDAVFAVQGENGSLPRQAIVHGDPGLELWRDDLAAWQELAGPVPEHREAFIAAPNPPQLDEGRVTLSARDEAQEARWFAAWGRRLLDRKAAGPPLIQLARPPLPMSLRVVASLALSLLAGGLCYGHHNLQQRRIEELKAAIEVAEQPAKAAAKLKQDAEAAQKAHDAVLKEVEALRAEAAGIAAVRSIHRERLARLLEAFSAHKPDGLLLQRIRREGTTLVLEGLCAQPDLANRLTSTLDADLRGLAWRIQPPKTLAQRIAPNGGPWSFELSLLDTLPEACVEADANTSVRNGSPRR